MPVVDFDSVLQAELEQITARRCQNLREPTAWEAPGDAALATLRNRVAEEVERAIRDALAAENRPAGLSESVQAAVAHSLHQAIADEIQETIAMTPVADGLRQPASAVERNLTGLAFSGGGIRSATFGLGVLQGLAELGLLRRFDYLSTVSGGGYIGSWFATWLKREGDLKRVERQLKPDRVEHRTIAQPGHLIGGAAEQGAARANADQEPAPIRHLREYSNYLAPRLGALSADSWTLAAIYLRNLLLNLLILIPSALFVVLAARCLLEFYQCPRTRVASALVANVLAFLTVLMLLVALGVITHQLVALCGQRTHVAERSRRNWGQAGVQLGVMIPLLIAAILASWLLALGCTGTIRFTGHGIVALVSPDDPARWWPQCLLFALVFGLVHFIAHVLRLLWVDWDTPAAQRQSGSARSHAAAYASGAAGGALIYVFATYFLLPMAERPDAIAAFGPPLVLIVFFVTFVIEAGLKGMHAGEDEREWWARLGAWLLIYAVCWATILGISFYGPLLLVAAGEGLATLLATGWLLTAAAGVLAGRSQLTRSGHGNRVLEVITLAAPPVFLAGLLCALSWLVSGLIDRPADWPAQPADPVLQGVAAEGPLQQQPPTGNDFRARSERYLDGLKTADRLRLVGLLVGTLAFGWLMALSVDVNAFSLHAMYANRLVRCYLGASRSKRLAHPFTRFDSHDDLRLHELQIGRRVTEVEEPARRSEELAAPQRYWGPYPLINTALNLVAGEELAWQERKAESFVLAPLYCGSGTTGYRPLPSYAHDVSVGRAVAISGAAASPNMGYHTSPAVAALLTVFNVRLGGWLPNPSSERAWRKSGPTFGYVRLLRELFSLTDNKSDFVYLSDGGHFENLGAYELVRRRCRLIVLCDGGADPGFSFTDLGNFVRKCRSDFGVDIEISTDELRHTATSRFGRWHCAIGTIRYDYVDRRLPVGTLVYMKPSLTGDEPADVLQYAECSRGFPHETTVDQFFSESQFEAYRALGYHLVREVFARASMTVEDKEFPLRDIDRPELERILVERAAALASQAIGPDLQSHRAQLQQRWALFGQAADRDAAARDVIEKVVREAVEQAVREAIPPGLEGSVRNAQRQAEKNHIQHCNQLISELQRGWLSPPPGLEENFLKSVADFVEMQRDLRGDPNLRRFSQQLYPELPRERRRSRRDGLAVGPVQDAEVQQAEFHAAAQMLQIMEKVWLGMHLEEYHSHPLNRGWLNLFQRWSSSPVLRRYWPLLRCEFSRGFVDFCERELTLDVAYPDPVVLSPGDAELSKLATEFAAEWPQEARKPERMLAHLVACAAKRENGAPLSWRFEITSTAAPADQSQWPKSLVGMATASSPDPNQPDTELFVWIRPPFRMVGLGTRYLPDLLYRQILPVLSRLQASEGGQRYLIVRYPREGWSGPGGRLQKKAWMRFFYLRGFRRRVREPRADHKKYIILERAVT